MKSFPLAERIEAGETQTAEFSMKGELQDGKDYMLVVEYGTKQYLDMHDAATDTIFFTAHNTPAYWKADGTAVPFSIEEGVTFRVPADAAAIDLSRFGASGTLDVSAASPNCLYYLSEDANVPEEIENMNVIKGKKAETINLSDGYGYYCPAIFTAENAFYMRMQGVDNASDGGWEPLTLPFDADGMELYDINGPHTSGNVTVKELSGINGDMLEFREVGLEGILSAIPYIMKVEVPETRIIFHGSEKVFSPSVPKVKIGNYCFTGNFGTQDINDAYVINSNGTAFEHKGNATTAPFRGYILAEDGTTEYDRLYIDRYNTAGIMNVEKGDANTGENVYTINGIKVNKGARLPEGIYVRNGKKIIIK